MMTRLASGALIAALFVGCGVNVQPAAPRVTPATTPAAVDIFDTGTWQKSLNATTCGDFTTKMTGAEQFQIARVLLATHRMGTLADAPAPSDALTRQFEQAVANICGEQGADYPIIGATAVVYTTDKSYEPAYR